jgi:ribosomal protein S18 acetylase RimI-like enzyme
MMSPALNLGDKPIIRRASATDAPLVIDIVEDAARWLQSRGIAQWQWFLTSGGRDLLRQRLSAHEVYLLIADAVHPDDAIATMTLQWTDSQFWGERGRDNTAGYIHGLAVRRSHAKQSLGAKLIQYAAERCRERGRPILRLDCMADNVPLRAYYERHGFDLVETRRVHDRFDSALYERVLPTK